MAKVFSQPASPTRGIVVNDIHSQLNPTAVDAVRRPRCTAEIAALVKEAAANLRSICIAGGRHAMGGQQFAEGATLLDMSLADSISYLDAQRGLVTVGGGITWGSLIRELKSLQGDANDQWTIIQKPSGADDISIAGSLSSNAHGRGLSFKPLVGDVESFKLIDAQGHEQNVSRSQNADLFSLAIGGYGMFGIIAEVTLRLAKRTKLRRHVEIIRIADLMDRFESRIDSGCTYGDFQFDIDNDSDHFLRRGIFAAYEPVTEDTPIASNQVELSLDSWKELLYLAHIDKEGAFKKYSQHYLQTDGQIYQSDVHQLSKYIDHYHLELDQKLGVTTRATEIITEVYVPRDRLTDFMTAAATFFKQHETNIIYGTIRLIEKDEETVLPWAKERYACIIFNLHTEHSSEGVQKSKAAFRKLIDLAIERNGSFYLTYHRFADKAQIEACYPQFSEWLQSKNQKDPAGVFDSQWFRHCKQLFST